MSETQIKNMIRSIIKADSIYVYANQIEIRCDSTGVSFGELDALRNLCRPGDIRITSEAGDDWGCDTCGHGRSSVVNVTIYKPDMSAFEAVSP